MPLVNRQRLPKRPRRDSQSGGAAIEFGLIMPLFLAVVCGTIDYGWYFYQRFALDAAVRDGIRAGLSVLSTGTPDSWTTAKTRAIAVLTQSNTIPNPSTSVTWGPASGSRYTGTVPNYALTFSGQYTFVPLIGFLHLPSNTMTYSMTMLLELEN
jgi:Flp pilus assembly protein TadG